MVTLSVCQMICINKVKIGHDLEHLLGLQYFREFFAKHFFFTESIYAEHPDYLE